MRSLLPKITRRRAQRARNRPTTRASARCVKPGNTTAIATFSLPAHRAQPADTLRRARRRACRVRPAPLMATPTLPQAARSVLSGRDWWARRALIAYLADSVRRTRTDVLCVSIVLRGHTLRRARKAARSARQARPTWTKTRLRRARRASWANTRRLASWSVLTVALRVQIWIGTRHRLARALYSLNQFRMGLA